VKAAPVVRWLALLWVVAGSGHALGQELPRASAPEGEATPSQDIPVLQPDSEREPEDVSPWYLERGTQKRQPTAEDDIPDVAFQLAELLRDGGIPGFYDGQFRSVQDRFDDLVRVAQDKSMHHTIRIMAVMALQEAADGERLMAALQPLLIDPELEFDVEYSRAYRDFQRQAPRPLDERTHRRELDVDLSRYTRFALAKDGQPQPILDRIRVLEQYVIPRRFVLLDPLVRTFRDFETYHGRATWFEIGYHYQQFDDYASAAEWFRQLTDSLEGADIRMAHYNLACIAALTGKPEEAVTELQLAADAGFLDVAWMEEDGDLESLRARDDYQALRMRLLGEEPPPTPPKSDPGAEDAQRR
jgi:hypothetical protein